ncbi:magnesium chelatase subunit H [Pontixanthobacter aestiaquae]|uniref:magnesium chelatase n=1 Tax=Pontixanthobacter aestiaquae TaxID=1509367 RepID=A0A844ZBD9_9SPHN|nr:magnesium chelatase subunit H [Pontixanthobacter aestiaquae]MDN3644783.1 magnesium chelatase subunit H [Pontixanthobacter aestiaquae]MXO84210.1 magnesium chelatase subunit H [Pontixanthobacter aestiaquae]
MHGSRPPSVRAVIITLDNHLAGAVERANVQLGSDGVSLALYAASDWDRDPTVLERAIEDIEQADIIIATMLFLEDHVRAIRPALLARRDDCDAIVGLMSQSDIVKLTKLGNYDMDKPAKGPLALLKKLRGSKKPGGSSGAGQMRMLRRLPKILKFVPGAAQDVRQYFLTMQYWLAGSDDNVVDMVRGLIDRYASGDRAALRGTMTAASPREYPEVGVYHPAMKGLMADEASQLPKKRKVVGTVGVLMLRSYLLGRDTGHYDGIIAALEAKGLKVIPAFASGLDARPAIEKFFVKDGESIVDSVINLTGFSLVGGPAYNDVDAAVEMLTELDVPYVAAHPIEFQSLEQWGAGRQGLLPLETTMMLAIPELDGAIIPSVFGGRADGAPEGCTGCSRNCHFDASGSVRAMQCCPDRAEALAGKVAELVALRKAEKAQRKLAIVLFNFPPNAGATGTAAHLAVFESLHATLLRLKREGYDVDAPASVDDLRNIILKGNAEQYGADANVAARISADDHVRAEPYLKEIEAQWGPAPGRQQSDGQSIHVYGAQFGHVFVGVQPAFGYEGDPMRLLFEGGFTPTHAFSAFYRYIRQDFGADACLHFGTHGALEFMPGKQAGMSGDCWPERLIGDLPNFYLYASNNPSEGIIAKRRSGATLISYLTPPLAEAGLTKGFGELKALVERHRTSDDATERAELEVMIRDNCAELDIEAGDLETLAGRVYEIERELIPHGLHVFGGAMSNDERNSLVDAMIAATPALERADIEATIDANDELGSLMRALDGSYVPPAPGGDILHNAEVLPTGRNLHGFDPFRIPSRFACKQGAAQAEQLLARHLESGDPLPESIAMVLWGTDNLKSEGAQIAQAMALLGARPRFDDYGRLAGAELIELGELGRPRIDVVVTLSGIFRDLLPLQTRMIAEATWLATMADESVEQNFVRKHSLAHQAKHGCDLETASLRVFSNAQGAYGANVNMMIDGGTWEDPEEIADMFETHKGYAYGRSGKPTQHRELLESELAQVDLTYQNLESVELGVTDIDHYVDGLGGMSKAVEKARGKAAPVYVVDATQGDTKVRTLGEQIDLETRTRMLNPKWYEGMLKHGFEGVRHIEGHVTNTMGWSATTGTVSPWVYQKISETFVLDDEMRARLANLNPKSSARVAERLLEATERDLWTPDAETLAALKAASNDLEDRLEGLVPAE